MEALGRCGTLPLVADVGGGEGVEGGFSVGVGGTRVLCSGVFFGIFLVRVVDGWFWSG